MIKYAPHGSEAFNAKVEESLAYIAARFDTLFSRNDLIALVLGGGYGRKEGGVLKSAEGEKLYNDLDFFVISKALSLRKKASISRDLKNLHQELSEEFGIDVDFAEPKSISEISQAPLTLMMYDLQHGYTVIWGNKHALQNLPRRAATELSISEAVKLLLNRGMGLYFAKEHLKREDYHLHIDFINRNIHKAYQAVAEAILIGEGKYHWSVFERMKRIAKLDISSYSSHNALKQLMQTAMVFKLQPHIPDEDSATLLDRVTEAITMFEEVYYKVWAAYFGVSKLDLKSYLNLLSSNKDQAYSVMSLAKNFALNMRDCGLKQANLNEYIKYPRYRLFYTLPWLLFKADMAPEMVASMLGIQECRERLGLEKRYVELWHRYN